MKRLTSLLLLLPLVLTACGTVSASSLSDGIVPRGNIAEAEISEVGGTVADFGVRLLREGFDGDNILLSPLSVMSALAMTANGAEQNTLAQMESVLGMDTDSLNTYLRAYTGALPSGDKYKLSLANSIWFTDDARFTVNGDFLQTNADCYGADIYKTALDSGACRDINRWVKESTDGMIPKIIDEIPPDAVMYLVNALAFEAEWQSVYEKHQVRDGVFTADDGSERKVKMMYSGEYAYLEDSSATGFIKYYDRNKYAFAALLPNEGISLSDYLSELTGESLYSMLSSPINTAVDTGIPKFELEYSTELSSVLSSMGMSDAFDMSLADFSRLGSSSGGNIFISRVLHRTYISVGERGTRAGAATVVEMSDGASIETEPPKTVILDRPFIFMLIDTESNLPFFIGAVSDIK